jgi:hypothetical protein
MAETGRDDVDGQSNEQQCGRVQVAKVVQPGVRQRCGRA